MKVISLFIAILILASSCQKTTTTNKDLTVTKVMDDVITRLYEQVPPDKYDGIDDAFMLDFLTEEEKGILATRYQYFTVNTPVIVSLMRDTQQKVIPFWLAEAGFVKTDNMVKNESYKYEVWEKKFPAGIVELGINGFDKHRPVYFISVAPQDPANTLSISDVYPQ